MIPNLMEVLVLDDREERHKVLIPLLEDNQCGVTSAYTVKEATEALSKNSYDLVFLDHDLGGQEMVKSTFDDPGDTGMAVVKHIIDNNINTGLIICHSLNQPARSNMCSKLNATGHEAVSIPFLDFTCKGKAKQMMSNVLHMRKEARLNERISLFYENLFSGKYVSCFHMIDPQLTRKVDPLEYFKVMSAFAEHPIYYGHKNKHKLEFNGGEMVFHAPVRQTNYREFATGTRTYINTSYDERIIFLEKWVYCGIEWHTLSTGPTWL